MKVLWLLDLGLSMYILYYIYIYIYGEREMAWVEVEHALSGQRLLSSSPWLAHSSHAFYAFHWPGLIPKFIPKFMNIIDLKIEILYQSF
jgi:hypothetical protein